MATKTIVTLVDDLTGEEGDVSTVEFGLDGAVYEIDLDEKNATELREFLVAYVDNARRVGRVNGAGKARRQRSTPAAVTRSTVTSAGPRSREASKAIRDWATSQGIEVSERGRIPNDVVERYDAAH